MEAIARHNISSGPKGKRLTIQAGQRFNSADYPDITAQEWDAMAKNGNITPPNEPNYASPTAIAAPVPEDKGKSKPARARQEDDDDDDDI